MRVLLLGLALIGFVWWARAIYDLSPPTKSMYWAHQHALSMGGVSVKPAYKFLPFHGYLEDDKYVDPFGQAWTDAYGNRLTWTRY